MTRLRVPVVAIGVAVLLLYGLGKWQGHAGAENDSTIRAANQALASGKAYRARQDSLRHSVDQRITTVRIRDTVVVRLAGQLVQDTTARDSVRTLLMVRDTLLAQRDSLVVAVRLLTVAMDSSDARIANLEANLRGTLKIADCRIAGIGWFPKCPSRTASFLVGAVGVGTLALLRH